MHFNSSSITATKGADVNEQAVEQGRGFIVTLKEHFTQSVLL